MKGRITATEGIHMDMESSAQSGYHVLIYPEGLENERLRSTEYTWFQVTYQTRDNSQGSACGRVLGGRLSIPTYSVRAH